MLDVARCLRGQLIQHSGAGRRNVGDDLAGARLASRARPSEEPPDYTSMRGAGTRTSMTCPYGSTARYT